MININKYIADVLSALPFENCYIKRPQKSTNCIIYTFKEYAEQYADGKETHTRYDCYFNLITTDINQIELVKKVLKDNHFKKVVVNSPYELENGLFEITMNYTKIKNNESEEL